MTAKAKALVHRLRQIRKTALRAELAVTAAQVLFWTALIAVPAGALLLARRRTRSEPAPWSPPPAPAHHAPQQPTSPEDGRAHPNSQG